MKIEKKDGAFVAFTITKGTEKLLIIYNPNETAVEYTLPAGGWGLFVNGTTAGVIPIGNQVVSTTSSPAKVSIAGISCYVYKAA